MVMPIEPHFKFNLEVRNQREAEGWEGGYTEESRMKRISRK